MFHVNSVGRQGHFPHPLPAGRHVDREGRGHLRILSSPEVSGQWGDGGEWGMSPLAPGGHCKATVILRMDPDKRGNPGNLTHGKPAEIKEASLAVRCERLPAFQRGRERDPPVLPARMAVPLVAVG